MRTADVGVFGGSGSYDFLDDVEEVVVDTPYGSPSAPFTIGDVGGRTVAFLPRHGCDHEFPPHVVNFRANLWAMREIGVERVVGPARPAPFAPTSVPVSSWSSISSSTTPRVGLTPSTTGHEVHVLRWDGIEGPRISTRAESAWFRSAGWDVVNMTQYPEAYLARELGICYSGIALVTDYDTGLEGAEGIEPVPMDEVFAFLEANVEQIRSVLFDVIPKIPNERTGCACADAVGPLPT